VDSKAECDQFNLADAEEEKYRPI